MRVKRSILGPVGGKATIHRVLNHIIKSTYMEYAMMGQTYTLDLPKALKIYPAIPSLSVQNIAYILQLSMSTSDSILTCG